MNVLLGKPFNETYTAYQAIIHQSVYWKQASRIASVQIWDTPGHANFQAANSVYE